VLGNGAGCNGRQDFIICSLIVNYLQVWACVLSRLASCSLFFKNFMAESVDRDTRTMNLGRSSNIDGVSWL
jgi:hypothetical protein